MGVLPEDLSPMWQKPTFEDIMSNLRSLRVDLPTWRVGEVDDGDGSRDSPEPVHQPQKVMAYLSSIIKSSLDWIQDEDLKEALWSEASKRISERSGRTGAYASQTLHDIL